MKYEVLFSGIAGADGDLHRRGEILDESEISDLERQVSIGAVGPVALIEEAPSPALESDEPPPPGDEEPSDAPETDDEPPPTAVAPAPKSKKGKK